MKMIQLSSMVLNAERISAFVTDPRGLDANGPAMPDRGSVVLLDGDRSLRLGAEDTRRLSQSLQRFCGLVDAGS